MKHKTLKINEEEVAWGSWSKGNDIAHKRKRMIDGEHLNKLYCDIYEIPPGKANWPIHYHSCNEEVFYIIEGQGELITQDEVMKVKPGDILRFPAGEKGTHQLRNTSNSQALKYLDMGTENTPDAVFMPDENKVLLLAGDTGADKTWTCKDLSE